MREAPWPEEWIREWAKKLKDHSLDELEFGAKTQKALKRNGINTVGELVIMTEDDLIKLPGIGVQAIADIKEVLRWDDLKLGIVLSDGEA